MSGGDGYAAVETPGVAQGFQTLNTELNTANSFLVFEMRCLPVSHIQTEILITQPP